jgi:hypothetical protein
VIGASRHRGQGLPEQTGRQRRDRGGKRPSGRAGQRSHRPGHADGLVEQVVQLDDQLLGRQRGRVVSAWPFGDRRLEDRVVHLPDPEVLTAVSGVGIIPHLGLADVVLQ